MLERIGHFSMKAAQGLRVRSALNPSLWLCAIVTPFSLLVASCSATSLVIVTALVMAVIPIVITSFGFLYFLVRAPEKLQSEDYQLRHETLQMIKVSEQPIAFDKVSIGEIASGARVISSRISREDQA
jgi:hypothetical protein